MMPAMSRRPGERTPRGCGVLQIEPTDFCNLACPMCQPQQGFRPNLHGDLARGYMDPALFRQIVEGIAASDAVFDHVIFQWLGDPCLHPELFEMLGFALDHVADRAGYFRIDTNAILLTRDRVEALIAACARHPLTPVLMVFSLDAVTPETYRRVKGRDRFDLVMDNIGFFLARRGELAYEPITLNAEFQFVLQAANHHEVRDFIDHWDAVLASGRNGVGYNDIMVKRLAVGTGGRRQHEADRLYADTIRSLGIAPFDKPHVHLKLWEERAWEEHGDPGTSDSDLDLGTTGLASPKVTA